MKINIAQFKVVVLFAFLAAPLVPYSSAQTLESRDRIAPKPTPISGARQTPTPIQVPTPSQTPRPQPTITPTASPGLQTGLQTLPELQTKIRNVLANPALARGRVGVKIVSLDSGKTIFEENAEKYFMPASNMKSFTMAAALDRLTPDFHFVTSVYAASKPDANGLLKGDLIIFGRGDPTFAASLNDGDYYRSIHLLADKITAAGVRKIEGNLVGDASYFSGDAIGATWEWDDLQWYYGAPISALTINDNSIDLKITPGASIGAPCFISILPANALFSVVNLTTTASVGTKRGIEVKKQLGTNRLEISGSMALGDGGYAGALAVENPAEMFIVMLKNALLQKGVSVAGQTRTINARDKVNQLAEIHQPQIEIARLESPPLSYIAAKTLKPSQNLYTELVLRALGETVGDKTNLKKTSAERGLETVAKFLSEAGIQPDAVVQFDGSGLSRHNLITPTAAVQLYAFMSKYRSATSFQAALPIGAVDGTLKNRFINTTAASRVFAKTGTIDQVGTLSGYTTTATGERLVFSILTNNLPNGALRRQIMDDIVLLLTNFNGKSE